ASRALSCCAASNPYMRSAATWFSQSVRSSGEENARFTGSLPVGACSTLGTVISTIGVVNGGGQPFEEFHGLAPPTVGLNRNWRSNPPAPARPSPPRWHPPGIAASAPGPPATTRLLRRSAGWRRGTRRLRSPVLLPEMLTA